MANLEDLGEVIAADVLVVGGSLSGVAAAIKAKEESPQANILLTDKQTIGWAGVAQKGMGGFWGLSPDDDIDKFAEYHIKNMGYYLNDQELLYSFARETEGAVKQLAAWGLKIFKRVRLPFMAAELGSGGGNVDLNYLVLLRNKARHLGINILDKFQTVDLLKQGDRVIGAVGFNIINGRFYIIKSKATILANGGCNYKNTRMWSASCGDGIAAAYRAGAEMRNAEFSCYYEPALKNVDPGFVFALNFLYNAKNENISQKYMAAVRPSDISSVLILGIAKEIAEGRGPIYVDLEQAAKQSPGAPLGQNQDRPYLTAFHDRESMKIRQYGPSPSPRPEITLNGPSGLSPIKVDRDRKTTLEGLFAVGDTSYTGSAWAGAVPSPPGGIRGGNLMNALLSAMSGGPAAARFISTASSPNVDYAEVKQLKESIFAPMQRSTGLAPADAVRAVQEIVMPVKYNLNKSQKRIEEAISKISSLQKNLANLRAQDGHALSKCHEAKSMATCAEITFNASMARTESRGWHYREDYPNRDDKNWLKWVIIKQKAGKPVISTEPVPIDKYKFKP